MRWRSGIGLHQSPWYTAAKLTLRLRGQRADIMVALLQQQGVVLEQIVWRPYLEITIRLSDFSAVYALCRREHVKFRIVRRFGGLFTLRRWAQRRAMLVGAGLFVVLLYLASQMIWRVDVNAPSAEVAESVTTTAADAGVRVGVWKRSLSPLSQLQQSILDSSRDVAWVGVRVDGSVAHLQVIPRIESPKATAHQPSNIIVTKPAVILAVHATRGTALVKSGELVRAGQVAITGQLGDGAVQVPAGGEVLGEVWYNSEVEVPLKVAHAQLSGEFVQRDYVSLAGLRIRVWGFKAVRYRATYRREQETDWEIFGKRLPVQWVEVRDYEVQPAVLLESERRAREVARHLAAADVRTLTSEESRILSQIVLHRQLRHGTLYETILTKVEEDIGVPAPIPAETTKKESDSVRG
ncbi:MAG: sporulation protein YqfD [Alicyclobacillaceae bacterium]|nr:sporulation protein YqfD [Alicyclobacillaceae bacterium]